MQVSTGSELNDDAKTDEADDVATPRPESLSLVYVLAGIGFALLLSWELSFVFGPPLALLCNHSMETAISLRLLATASLAGTFIFFLRRPDFVYKRNKAMIIVGLICAILGLGCTAISSLLQDSFPVVLLVFAWLLIGVAQGSIAALWQMFFCIIPTRRTAITIGWASIGGTILFVFLNLASSSFIGIIEISVALVLSVVVLLLLTGFVERQHEHPIEDFEYEDNQERKRKLMFPQMIGIVYGVTYGLITTYLCAMGPATALVAGMSGLLGTALALLWGYLGSRIDMDFMKISYLSFPAIVTGMLLFPLFDGVGRVICGGLVVTALAHSTTFSYFDVAVSSHEFRIHPIRREAERGVPQWIGFCLGSLAALITLFKASDENGTLFILVLIIVICTVFAFSLWAFNNRYEKRFDSLISNQGHQLEKTEYTLPFRKRCDDIIQRYDLTSREAEVFRLLAKGRNAEHISKELCVSIPTIKTHIYHIYRKLGIGSQQSLLNIVDDIPLEGR